MSRTFGIPQKGRRRTSAVDLLSLLQEARSDELMSLGQAAQRLGVSADELARWVLEGLIRADRLDDVLVFRRRDVAEWVLRGLSLGDQVTSSVPVL
jgi:hypothetical protein